MKFIGASTWLSLLGSSVLTGTDAIHLRRSLQGTSATVDSSFDRVDGINRTYAECVAENGATGPVDYTPVTYYYAIHATSAIDQKKAKNLEDILFNLIQTTIMWCTLPKQAGIDLGDGGRKFRELLQSQEFKDFQQQHRKLSFEKSRQLSILAFNNNPIDESIDNLFDFATTPCQFSNELVCGMMKGSMGITAHASDNLELLIASILDAIQDVMTMDMLIEPLCLNEVRCVVTKVEFWGTTLEAVANNVYETRHPPTSSPGNGGDDDDDNGSGNIRPTVSPSPTVTPSPSHSPAPSQSPAPTTTPAPTVSPSPTVTPSPSHSPAPSQSTAPTTTPAPTVSPSPTVTPGPSQSAAPTKTPAPSVVGDDDDDDDDGSGNIQPTVSPSPTVTPGPTQSPAPSQSPAPTQSPAPSVSSAPTADRGVDGLNQQAKEGDDDQPLFLFAAVPLAALAALMLLLARNRRDRNVMTAAEFDGLEDYVRPGTGDPPRSFHEGMYHYTRSGARYLSTNCPDCHESRKMAMSHSFADLPPIDENRLHDGNFSYSYDDLSSVDTEVVEVSAHDPSGHRKQFLVQPSENNLAKKSSTVDVHHCASATCRICAYKPKDVCFIESPASPRRDSATREDDTAMSYLPALYSTEDSLRTGRRYDTVDSQESI